jgi:hypothetical protein
MYYPSRPRVNNNLLKSNNFLHKLLALLAFSDFLLDLREGPVELPLRKD